MCVKKKMLIKKKKKEIWIVPHQRQCRPIQQVVQAVTWGPAAARLSIKFQGVFNLKRRCADSLTSKYHESYILMDSSACFPILLQYFDVKHRSICSTPLSQTRIQMTHQGCTVSLKTFKVCVKRILRIVSKHITNVRNGLLKHITKTLNYVVLNCEVKPLNSFSPILCSGFFGRG